MRGISMNFCLFLIFFFNICVCTHILSCTTYWEAKWWCHRRNEHTKTPFFKGTGGSLRTGLLPELGQRKCKMNLEHVIAPENQKRLKKWVITRSRCWLYNTVKVLNATELFTLIDFLFCYVNFHLNKFEKYERGMWKAQKPRWRSSQWLPLGQCKHQNH